MSNLERYAKIVADEGIPGDVVEIGVADGKSVIPLRGIFPAEKRVFAYDTFKGMPVEYLLPGEEHLASIRGEEEDIVEKLTLGGIIPVVGVFPHTILRRPDLFPEKICFVHIDVDNYLTTRIALRYVWPRLQNGGVIALHDFTNPETPGVPRAITEFLAKTDGAVAQSHVDYLVIRRENGLGSRKKI